MAHFIGIDVQERRDCPFAVLDGRGRLVESGWLPPKQGLEAGLDRLCRDYPDAHFGVDAPRQPLRRPRPWYWRARRWQRRRPADKGQGRHCEVVIAAHRLANPQWTPLRGEARDWMRVGFRIFDTLSDRRPTHEVFPSAAYRQLRDAPAVRASLSFEAFQPGPKDMLDAVVAALTVRELDAGRGVEVGGGDGLGTIALPRPLEQSLGVETWPESP
ncbi:MAG: hypothetical protein QNK05_06275 [Myxococcota bacterium]|nr:hypothetical protein [Myxococcota bacterium]